MRNCVYVYHQQKKLWLTYNLCPSCNAAFYLFHWNINWSRDVLYDDSAEKDKNQNKQLVLIEHAYGFPAHPNLSSVWQGKASYGHLQLQGHLGSRVFRELDTEKVISVLMVEFASSYRCMVGYVNASLSVFRISDFENRSEPESDGSEFSGTPLKYCRWVWHPAWLCVSWAGSTMERFYSKGRFWPSVFKAVTVNLNNALKAHGKFSSLLLPGMHPKPIKTECQGVKLRNQVQSELRTAGLKGKTKNIVVKVIPWLQGLRDRQSPWGLSDSCWGHLSLFCFSLLPRVYHITFLNVEQLRSMWKEAQFISGSTTVASATCAHSLFLSL